METLLMISVDDLLTALRWSLEEGAICVFHCILSVSCCVGFVVMLFLLWFVYFIVFCLSRVVSASWWCYSYFDVNRPRHCCDHGHRLVKKRASFYNNLSARYFFLHPHPRPHPHPHPAPPRPLSSPRADVHTVGMLRCYGLSDTNQSSLPTSFYSVLVSASVFIALSTVFYFINSPDNSSFSDSVLPALFLRYRSFQLYISLWKSPLALT